MPGPPSSHDDEKRAAAEAAAALVCDGMAVGLGTGTTVAHLLPALAGRRLRVRCVATSVRTAELAVGLGLAVEPFDVLDRLDIAIDGADQVAPDGWLVKGGGAAHTREKLVAATADRFVVIVDSSKPVAALSPPVPLELLAFGAPSTIRRLEDIGPLRLRAGPKSPDGGLIADYLGPVEDPAALARRLSDVPGLVEHGLFPPDMVSVVLVGRAAGAVERWVPRDGTLSVPPGRP